MTEQHPFHILLPQQTLALRRRALKLTSDEHRAEDLVQETFLKAWKSRDSYRPETNLGAWLFTILRNTFFSDLRKSRREVEDVDGAFALALVEEPRQDHALAFKELISAIALLPDLQRRPIELMGAYDYSQLETADACGCTIGTIKSRVSRGRATLSRIMAHDEVVAHVARMPRPGRTPVANGWHRKGSVRSDEPRARDQAEAISLNAIAGMPLAATRLVA